MMCEDKATGFVIEKNSPGAAPVCEHQIRMWTAHQTNEHGAISFAADFKVLEILWDCNL